MSTSTSHIRLRRPGTATHLLALLLVVTALAAGVATPGSAHRQGSVVMGAPNRASTTQAPCAYGWPVKPFGRQHPVRGLFGDPRIGRADDGSVSRQFHFGIDISAPNGTPVYATRSGTVSLPHPGVVAILSGSSEFSYWHVIPTVRSGMHAVAYRTVIGRIEKPWAHVHFSERVDGIYLNPLRPGALGPYADGTRPTVEAIRFARDGSGRLDLVAEVFDDTPLPVARPWTGKPVMPAIVRWRLLGPEVAASGWSTAIDLRQTIPDASSFFAFYADGTRQDHASVQGLYCVYLTRDLDLRALPNGRYAVEVVASDGHGNSASSVARFAVRNGSAAL
jgi:hypothetical protein